MNQRLHALQPYPTAQNRHLGEISVRPRPPPRRRIRPRSHQSTPRPPPHPPPPNPPPPPPPPPAAAAGGGRYVPPCARKNGAAGMGLAERMRREREGNAIGATRVTKGTGIFSG